MAYLGRQPVIGNFVKLDAISVVNGQAAYTMQNNSVNFTDYATVNQFLVSLNGTVQSPGSSFTVNSSVITFASNLSTGDVIDFIIVFGNSLSAGTPTDGTVSLAKLSATGTKDATTFLRGDNTFATAGLTGVTTDSGNVTITDGDLIFGGAGHGVYLGVTSATAANHLDDYETGTWTPTFSHGISSISYGGQSGRYTKIGDIVYFDLSLSTTGGSSVNTRLRIGGFPFTAVNSGAGHASIGYTDNALINSTSTNLPTLFTEPSTLDFYNSGGGQFVGTDLNDPTSINIYISGFRKVN
jgi:hypothetical protein